MPSRLTFDATGRDAHGPALTAAAPSAPRLALRPTMLSDLEFVVAVEHDAANLPFITPWDRTQHEGAVRFPDFRHFIVEAAPAFERTGFVILQGCRNPHRSIELKRIVLQAKGRGLGRECVRVLKRMAFLDLHAHRFWLDVKALNDRALALYRSEGFVEEGRLREAVRVAVDGGGSGGGGSGGSGGAGSGAADYDSLVVMGLLDREFHARAALGLEGPP